MQPAAAAAAARATTRAPVCDFYVVLDFEAAFDKPSGFDKVMEVIELPSVILDARTGTTVAEFQRYARPTIHPKMHPEVTQITGITQATVDAAKPFPVVFAEYRQWLQRSALSPVPATAENKHAVHPNSRSFIFVTCGDWDIKTMLPIQIRNDGGAGKLASMDHPTATPAQVAASASVINAFSAQWCNLKDVFNAAFPAAGVRGMTDMLRHLSLPLIGRHHSGIDDCRNIAAVLKAMLERGVRVDVTNTRASLNGGIPNGKRFAMIQVGDTSGLPGRLPAFSGDPTLAFALSTLVDRKPAVVASATQKERQGQAPVAASEVDVDAAEASPTPPQPTGPRAPVGATLAAAPAKRKGKQRLQ
jgi:ERI1 exoribonuclease 3